MRVHCIKSFVLHCTIWKPLNCPFFAFQYYSSQFFSFVRNVFEIDWLVDWLIDWLVLAVTGFRLFQFSGQKFKDTFRDLMQKHYKTRAWIIWIMFRPWTSELLLWFNNEGALWMKNSHTVIFHISIINYNTLSEFSLSTLKLSTFSTLNNLDVSSEKNHGLSINTNQKPVSSTFKALQSDSQNSRILTMFTNPTAKGLISFFFETF